MPVGNSAVPLSFLERYAMDYEFFVFCGYALPCKCWRYSMEFFKHCYVLI